MNKQNTKLKRQSQNLLQHLELTAVDIDIVSVIADVTASDASDDDVLDTNDQQAHWSAVVGGEWGGGGRGEGGGAHWSAVVGRGRGRERGAGWGSAVVGGEWGGGGRGEGGGGARWWEVSGEGEGGGRGERGGGTHWSAVGGEWGVGGGGMGEGGGGAHWSAVVGGKLGTIHQI